ncbi:hypothetical protein AB0A70_34705, partial [Streptomyces morookaense]
MTEHPNSHGSAPEPAHAPAHGHGEDAAPGRSAAGAYGTPPRTHHDPDPAAPGRERCRAAAAGAAPQARQSGDPAAPDPDERCRTTEKFERCDPYRGSREFLMTPPVVTFGQQSSIKSTA